MTFLLKFDSSHCILFFWFSKVLLRSDTVQLENLTLSGSVAVGQLEFDEDKNQSFDEEEEEEEEDDSVTLVDLTGSGGGLVGE